MFRKQWTNWSENSDFLESLKIIMSGIERHNKNVLDILVVIVTEFNFLSLFHTVSWKKIPNSPFKNLLKFTFKEFPDFQVGFWNIGFEYLFKIQSTDVRTKFVNKHSLFFFASHYFNQLFNHRIFLNDLFIFFLFIWLLLLGCFDISNTHTHIIMIFSSSSSSSSFY